MIVKMIDRFIISPLNGEKFINNEKINDRNIIINTSIEDAKNVNKIGVVKSLPISYSGNIIIGDSVVVHHNTFRDYFNGQGQTKISENHIKDDLYYVKQDSIFLIIRGEEKIPVDDFCFIEPIFKYEKWVGNMELEHQGIVKYTNKSLIKIGVNIGDKIGFHNNCEVPFVIDGKLLYKMKTHRILAKIN